MKNKLFMLLSLTTYYVNAQVGIGTDTPIAELEIVSNNKSIPVVSINGKWIFGLIDYNDISTEPLKTTLNEAPVGSEMTIINVPSGISEPEFIMVKYIKEYSPLNWTQIELFYNANNDINNILNE